MDNVKLIAPESLHELLKCDFEAGILFWKPRDVSFFSDGKYSAQRSCDTWNAKCAGKQAFTAEMYFGYKVGRIFQRSYRAHRVVYAMFYNMWPEFEIDHIDGNPRNNAIRNLRDVRPKQNRRNMRTYSTNKSGQHGVNWNKSNSKWHARISGEDGVVNLGYFENLDDAIAARQAAEIELGYHENHGRAAE